MVTKTNRSSMSSILELFEDKKLVKTCAPMVRYSKLPFRTLVRKYNCDLCFTPMIMSDSFVKSEKARNNEFTTDDNDTPLIAQFAATNVEDFVTSATLVSPYCDGVDLNCGCPQRWAMKLGIGAAMLQEPQTIKDIVLGVRNRVSKNMSVSVKMRLHSDSKYMVNLCQQIESAGATLLTIHPRTKEQKTDPINVDLLKDICLSVKLPVIGNGDVKTLDEAERLQELTGCQGVMCARGILQNPAMFSGVNSTPHECVKEWIEISLRSNLHFITFHHHLVFMLSKVINKYQKRIFNNLNNYQQVLAFLNKIFDFNFVYEPQETPLLTQECSKWETNNIIGSYFMKETKEDDMENILDGSLSLYQ